MEFRVTDISGLIDTHTTFLRPPHRNTFLAFESRSQVFVNHPLIKPNSVWERSYQRELADACLDSSTLVVLPTGLGKTVIALLVIADVLRDNGGKVMFLAPTKPLVEQHASFLRANLLGRDVAMMTGEVEPAGRRVLWDENDVIVSTPQVIANDLRNGLDLGDVRLIIFDEAHRGVGDYAYVKVAEAYKAVKGRTMAITASPGVTKKKILAVCENLSLDNIEARSEEDDSVSDYVFDIGLERVEVEVPERLKEVIGTLRPLHESYIKQLVKMRAMSSKRPPTTMYLLEVSRSLQARLRSGGNKGYLFRALSLQAMAIKVGHAIELAETQGTDAVRAYLGSVKREAGSSKGSKASRAVATSDEFAKAWELLEGMDDEHPKMPLLADLVSRQIASKPSSRIMVFTNYRGSCETVVGRLSELDGAKVHKLVGQTDKGEDKGLRQKEQVEVLSRLRGGEINVVVATCVGEEGLDVADTDLVVFYEPVPSAIRSIQRRGRTGRTAPGRVVIFITKGTRDEMSMSTSTAKEGTMKRNLARIKKQMDARRAMGEVPIERALARCAANSPIDEEVDC